MAREAATSLELRIEEHGQSNMEGDKFSELPFPGRILNSRTIISVKRFPYFRILRVHITLDFL